MGGGRLGAVHHGHRLAARVIYAQPYGQVATLKSALTSLLVTPTGEVVHLDVPQLPFLLRAIYFVLVGWWLSAIWLAIAWALHVTIIGMLVGFWMYRVPAVVSLAR
jgi:uncharacterized membrane protein YccF (DUF307 family)